MFHKNTRVLAVLFMLSLFATACVRAGWRNVIRQRYNYRKEEIR